VTAILTFPVAKSQLANVPNHVQILIEKITFPNCVSLYQI